MNALYGLKEKTFAPGKFKSDVQFLESSRSIVNPQPCCHKLLIPRIDCTTITGPSSAGVPLHILGSPQKHNE
jgi:hypothetical protein